MLPVVALVDLRKDYEFHLRDCTWCQSCVGISGAFAGSICAQEVPSDYQEVLKTISPVLVLRYRWRNLSASG
jgi:hypothetical protein